MNGLGGISGLRLPGSNSFSNMYVPVAGFVSSRSARKVCERLLCATSVFSVPLWLFLPGNSEPQRHREHRGCTEKAYYLTFRAKPV